MTKTYTDDESIQRFQEKATKDIEIERNRAYLFALVSLGLAITAVIALIAITPLKTVEPLIVTVDSATARVLKVQVATPDVITANDSVIQSELAKYIMVRETIDPEDRQRLVDLTRLHTTQSAIDEYGFCRIKVVSRKLLMLKILFKRQENRIVVLEIK